MTTWLLSPLAWLLLAGALALCSWWLRGTLPRLLFACGVVCAFSLACMTPIVSNALLAPLERPVLAPLSCGDSPPSIALVLGGGTDQLPRDRGDFAVLNLSSRRRMDRAVAWWRDGEGRNLVLVGGAGHGDGPALSELMAAYAELLGMPLAALQMEIDSDNTWGNARHSAGLVPQLPRRIVLVTSAMHMPRAHAAFEGEGFDVCPLASDFRSLPTRLPWALVPRTSGLVRTEAALHEWVGLAYYRWLARRSSSRPTGVFLPPQ